MRLIDADDLLTALQEWWLSESSDEKEWTTSIRPKPETVTEAIQEFIWLVKEMQVIDADNLERDLKEVVSRKLDIRYGDKYAFLNEQIENRGKEVRIYKDLLRRLYTALQKHSFDEVADVLYDLEQKKVIYDY